MKIGLLTGGGDCPGLNAAIRAVVKHAEIKYGHTVVGFRGGWQGAVNGDLVPLMRDGVRNILTLGGTMLGTGRYHPDEHDGATDQIIETLDAEHIESVICIGGDGTLYAAGEVSKHGIKVVGIPKTIDNDVFGTERAIGFDTALTVATEAIDRLHTTAESHHRVMVVELMGRTAGWITINAGIAGGADVILTPEAPFDIAEVARKIKHRHKSHASFSIVAVAEGAEPAKGTDMEFSTKYNEFGAIIAGSIGEKVKDEIKDRTGFDTRVTVLGHVQRGGTPTSFDRILASRFGVAAVDAISEGKTNVVTCLDANRIVLRDFAEVSGKLNRVPEDLLYVAKVLE